MMWRRVGAADEDGIPGERGGDVGIGRGSLGLDHLRILVVRRSHAEGYVDAPG